MKTKLVHPIFSFIFILMLLTPLMYVDIYGGKISEREKRFLASRPAVADIANRPENFIKQFDSWFSDNIGFREKFIDAYQIADRFENQIQYTEGSYVMLIGENGHRYFAYVDGWMIGKFQGKPFLSDAQLQGLSNGLNKIKRYLDEKNIPFIVMLCTDKETIYPEYYPKSIKRGPEPGHLDRITNYIKENTNVDVFNIRARLWAEKDNYLLYPKAVGDLSHYNDVGGFFAYQELMKHLNTYTPDMKPLTVDDVNIVYDDNLIPSVSLKQKISYKQLEPYFFDDIELIRPFVAWENRAFENHDHSLPVILVMQDSYAIALCKYIPEHFGKTILIHWRNMANLVSYIEYFKPDIVVFESVERELSGFANSVSVLQDLEVKR